MNAFAALLAPHGSEPTCDCRWIGRMLAHDGSDALLVAYIEELIAEAGFPPPLPHRKHGGGLSTGVHVDRSHWIRAGVVEWFGKFLPPAAAAALDEAAMDAAAEEMDAAAENLCTLRLVADNDEQVAA